MSIEKNDIENKKITEKRNELSIELDKMNTDEIVEIMNEEDKKVAKSVSEIREELSEFIEATYERMKKGGRLIYVGAGSSGRMGVIDAVECPPTFGVDSEKVKGIIAGGPQAMFTAFEGLEDDKKAGENRIVDENVNKKDIILGIAASGSTPFVIGAVEKAGELGALTGGLVCNYNSELLNVVKHELKVIVGPEVVSGSTRLKAATAQKMVLNIISTTVMARLNKVYSNLMVDLNVKNNKLETRAVDIFREITDEDEDVARRHLKMADFNIKQAVIMFEKGVDRKKAKEILAKHEGNLRKVIG